MKRKKDKNSLFKYITTLIIRAVGFIALTALILILELSWWSIKLPFRFVGYLWHFSWGRLWLYGMSFILFILIFAHLAALQQKNNDQQIISVYADQLSQKDNKIDDLTRENEDLKIQTQVALTESQHPILSEDSFDTLVSMLFPKQAGDRYKTIIESCENSSRNPLRVNKNTNGSFDLGVSQINSVHSASVEKFFGEDFISAMSDSVKNIVYAAILYHQQGNLNAWTCNHIVPQNIGVKNVD